MTGEKPASAATTPTLADLAKKRLPTKTNRARVSDRLTSRAKRKKKRKIKGLQTHLRQTMR